MTIVQAQLDEWNTYFSHESIGSRLQFVGEIFADSLSFACSFGYEDMLLLDLIAENDIACEVFYLDTGRLPEETYALISDAEKRYARVLRPIFPQAEDVESLIISDGINGFYRSIANRRSCCEVRKVRPLERALNGKKAWITGLRREQSQARSSLKPFEFDASKRIKISPLYDWSWDQLKDIQSIRRFPINKLHQRGYSSIGCAPCTRPAPAHADFRQGRWWWEQNSSKECGLHSYK